MSFIVAVVCFRSVAVASVFMLGWCCADLCNVSRGNLSCATSIQVFMLTIIDLTSSQGTTRWHSMFVEQMSNRWWIQHCRHLAFAKVNHERFSMLRCSVPSRAMRYIMYVSLASGAQLLVASGTWWRIWRMTYLEAWRPFSIIWFQHYNIWLVYSNSCRLAVELMPLRCCIQNVAVNTVAHCRQNTTQWLYIRWHGIQEQDRDNA